VAWKDPIPMRRTRVFRLQGVPTCRERAACKEVARYFLFSAPQFLQDVKRPPGREYVSSASPATTQNVPSSTFGIDLGFIILDYINSLLRCAERISHCCDYVEGFLVPKDHK
jgi:hypothetical protein